TLPAGTTFVSADAGGTFANGAVTWNVGTLAAGVTSHTVHVTVHIAPGTTSLRNVATVATSSFEIDHSNNVFVLTTPVGVQGRDLVITKSAPPTQNAGSRFTYTVTATNQGQLSATNVVVTDTLPVGATFVSATDNPTVNGRILTWSLGTLAAGASRVLTVTVHAPPLADPLLNVAPLIRSEPHPN